jgi:hypothetical protein
MQRHLGAALARLLRAQGIAILRVTTTNGNLSALHYQRRGFRIVAVRPDAAASRRTKPGIPEVGEYGIPIRDEIELVLMLDPDRVA